MRQKGIIVTILLSSLFIMGCEGVTTQVDDSTSSEETDLEIDTTGELVEDVEESNDSTKELTTEQWLEDIDEVVNTIYEKHPNPFISITEEEWINEIERFKQEIPNLSDSNIRIRFKQIVASLGDAHTNLISLYENFNLFLFQLSSFQDELRVLGTTIENTDILGAQLIKINNTDIEEVIDLIDTIIASETKQGLRNKRGRDIIYKEVLEYFEIVDTSPVEFTFIDIHGNEVTRVIEVVKFEEYNGQLISFVPEREMLREKFIEDEEIKYWYEYLEEIGTLYINYRVSVIHDAPFRKFLTEIDSLFDDEDRVIKKVIVDLRDNEGGRAGGSERLAIRLAALQSEHAFDTYTLIGKKTASGGVLAAANMKNYLNTTLIGEETGGASRFFGSTYKSLSNSNAIFRYGINTYDVSMNPQGGVLPDIEVIETFEDYQQGIDAALNRALQ